MENVELSNEDALIILFLFLYQKSGEDVAEKWIEFENEIKYGSRFFPKSNLLDEIKRLETKAEEIVCCGEKFYRARLIEDKIFGIKYEHELCEIVFKYYPEMRGKNTRQVYYFLQSIKVLLQFNEPFKDEITSFFQKNKRFWGYNSKESDAPPNVYASPGRANSRFISFLYLADCERTAISEVKPHIGQSVSVAEIRIDKDLKIYDFTSTKIVDNEDLFTLSMISEIFSGSKKNSEEEYYATQYLCEYIKNIGYDGIRFKSSINNGGKNTVLFDTGINCETKKKNYTVLKSKILNVSNIDIQYNQMAPFVDWCIFD